MDPGWGTVLAGDAGAPCLVQSRARQASDMDRGLRQRD